MRILGIEHSRRVYLADFVLYGMAVTGLALFLALAAPAAQRWDLLGWVLLGLAAWTAVEYGVHRFVMHGLQPFARWHAEHHARPQGYICSPTVFSASLFAVLVFAPMWVGAGLWRASALTLGLVGGYLAYGIVHHAVHHWPVDYAWLRRRRLWHAMHHHRQPPQRFGVSSGFWDRVFGTAGAPR